MITTVQQHIVQQFCTGARGFFSWPLRHHARHKDIQAWRRCAGLLDALGLAGETNACGESSRSSTFTPTALLHCLGVRDAVAILVSEENDHPVTFDRAPDTGKYVVVFDPLDGSSNIDVNVNVGTIFSIFRRPDKIEVDHSAAVLQPGLKQVAAGYVVYGSSTVFVYTAGRGVFGFHAGSQHRATVGATTTSACPATRQVLFRKRIQRGKLSR